MSLFRREKSPISPPSAYRSGIPLALDRVLLRALSQDPSGRYPRMSDFAAALLEAGRNYLRRSLHPSDHPQRPSLPPHSAARAAEPFGAPRPFGASSPNTPPAFVPREPHTPSPVGDVSRSSRPPSSLTSELAELEDLIRAARSAPNLSEAVDATVRALERAENTMSTQVERRVSDNHRFFEELLQRYLGGASSILEVYVRPGNDGHAPQTNAGVLTPKRAFLLSRVDGMTNSAELLQLSPMPRLDTLAHLAALMRAGMIRIKS